MDFTTQFLWMLAALFLVCLGAVVFLRFFLPRLIGNRRWNKQNHFEILSRFALDARRALYLMRIGKRYFVIGSAESGLNLISEIASEELGGGDVREKTG